MVLANSKNSLQKKRNCNRCENSFWDGLQSFEGEITEVIFQGFMKYYNWYGWFERPAPLCTTQELTQQIYLLWQTNVIEKTMCSSL